MIISPPSGKKIYCLHQRWISLLNNNFHVINQKRLHFLLQSLLLYYFHFTLVLFAYIGHANFDVNQCSVITDCCFKLWKRFEWSLLLRFSSTQKTMPLPLAKFTIPAPPLTVMLFEKPWALFKVGDQRKMKLIHFVIKWIVFYQYFYFQYVTLWKITLWYVKTICWQQTVKDFIKVIDTIAPLGTCDISFSLPSNSHGNFHIKIAFAWIPLH